MAIEILAPVGNEEMLRAAVYSGADAVYLGLTSFNARQAAGNFSPEALAKAVCFCHARGVRVYVTLNTTIYTAELPTLAEAVAQVADAGADALLVQDLATAALARQMCPSLALHASTQMSVHSLAGVKQMAALGFVRVVLARELSLSEITEIAQNCGIETEVFVHGALCMSVSGQCYMSAFLGGRSGNRGSCAGTCRLPFSAGDAPGHHLSLKDMSILDALPQLEAIGVCSAKIEGRLRPPEYVAAAVHACLSARAGQPYDADILRKVFSRSGFTDGYFRGDIGGQMFGVRTAEDSAASRAALPQMRELYRRERAAVPIEWTVETTPDGCKLTARDSEGNHAQAYTEPPQPPQSDPRAAIEKALGKTGGTPFAVRALHFVGEPGYLPASAWNDARRAALENLLQKREAPHPLPCAAAQLPKAVRTLPAKRAVWARFAAWQQVPPAAASLEKLVLPLLGAQEIPENARGRVLLELPRALFGGWEEKTAAALDALPSGFAGVVVSNPAHIWLCAQRGLPMHGAFGLNVSNLLAALEYEKLGLQSLVLLPELTLSAMAAVRPGIPTGALTYGHMPLMLTRACPRHNLMSCAQCGGHPEPLTDRKGRHLTLECGLGVRTIYNPVPLYMGDRRRELPTDFELLYFTQESKARAQQVLTLYAAASGFDQEFTRGLYYKGTADVPSKETPQGGASPQPGKDGL